MSKKYYGVTGVNAYGVYDNYEKVMETKKFIAEFKCKAFSKFDAAKEWSEDRYYELQGDSFFGYQIQEIQRLNWTYYRRKICL